LAINKLCRSQTTDGNASLGPNTATSRVYGTAVGADYRLPSGR